MSDINKLIEKYNFPESEAEEQEQGMTTQEVSRLIDALKKYGMPYEQIFEVIHYIADEPMHE